MSVTIKSASDPPTDVQLHSQKAEAKMLSNTGDDWHLTEHGEPAALRLFGKAIDMATIALGAIIIVLVFINVVLHAVERDLAWTTELSEVLMVWVTFIGGAAAARRGEHIAISELVDLLGSRSRRVAIVLAQLLSVAVLLLLIYYGAKVVELGLSNRLTVLDWPMAVEYLALPMGAAATLVFVLYDLFNIISRRSCEDRAGD